MRIVYSTLITICLGPFLLAIGEPQMPPKPSPGTVVTVDSIFTSYPKLEAQAKEIGDAFVRKDLKRFSALTLPKLIEVAGGREKFINMLSEEMKQEEAQGLEVLSLMPIDVTQLMKASGTLYAVMPTALRLKMRGELFESYGCLVGISNDDGQHWTFLEPGVRGVKDLLPDVADKLMVCPAKRPVKLTSK
jgi:hypothetical protein